MNASTTRLILVPGLPCIGGEGSAVDGDDLLDRQAVLFREREVALVVAGNAHDRALAIGHEDVVADPELGVLARERMRHVKAGRHALLFHRRELGLDDRAALAFVDEGCDPRIRARRVRCERVLRRHCAEGDAHDGVGPRREHPQLAVADKIARCIPDVVREGKAHAFAAADPVGLHRAHALGPASHLFQIVEELVRIVGDPQVIHRDLALLDLRARAPAFAIDHLLVGKHRLIDRIPVDHAGLLVRDAALEHLEKQPLIPAVIPGLAGRKLARPVDREPHRLHLFFHVRDVVVGPLRRSDTLFHRRVFRRQPERIPAHRHQHVVPVHAHIPVHHVADGVVAHVPHVQHARRVRKHRNAIELRPAGALPGAKALHRSPVRLRRSFDSGGAIRLHEDSCPTWSRGLYREDDVRPRPVNQCQVRPARPPRGQRTGPPRPRVSRAAESGLRRLARGTRRARPRSACRGLCRRSRRRDS